MALSKTHEGLDKAYDFLTEVHAVTGDTKVDLAAVRRRIDWRIVPLMFACYFVQILDKLALNYAAVMGLTEDLNLTKGDFSNVATAFFAAYMGGELINSLALQKVSPAKWLGGSVIIYGVACGATAGATNYTTLVVARVFLGIFESAAAPSLILICSQWYRKEEQTLRFSLWYCGVGVAQIVGALIAYGLQEVQGASLAAWRILFLVVGAMTIMVGVTTWIFLPDSPMSATFLSHEEKAVILRHVSINRTGVSNKTFRRAQVVNCLLDSQVWLITIITILYSMSSGVSIVYSSTLLKLFGYSSRRAILLNTPSGAIGTAATLITGVVLRYRIVPRSVAVTIASSGSLLGACLLAFVPAPTPLNPTANLHNRPALLAGIYLIQCNSPCLYILYAWVGANVAGSTKRVLAMCLVASSFSGGSLISLQTFRPSDASTGYEAARISVVGTQAGVIVLTGVLAAWYYVANTRKGANSRSRSESEMEGRSVETEVWKGMTDVEDQEFRYEY